MARDFTAVLQQAMEFFVAGQIVEARALLLDVVRADSKQEAGWMFLSYTLENPEQKADCYRKVLAINPRNAEARDALKKIDAQLHPGPKPPPRTEELLEGAPKQTNELLDEASKSAPPSSDGLLHAAPFTVDIEHADDEITFLGKESGPSAADGKSAPAEPAHKPTPVSAIPERKASPAPPAATAASPRPAETPDAAEQPSSPTAAKSM